MKNLLEYKSTSIFLILAVGWFGLMAFGTWRARNAVDRQANELQARISEVERDNKELEKLRSQYGNPDYLEKEAKIKLNYKIPGEQVVYVYKSEKDVPGYVPAEDATPNWKKWVEWAFGKSESK